MKTLTDTQCSLPTYLLAKERFDERIGAAAGASYVLVPGNGCVMFSAPHSVEQTRDGQVKYAEPETGALVEALHELVGYPFICKTANCGDDANDDERSPYRDDLAEYLQANPQIRCLIDLHQLSPSRSVGINLGISRFENIREPKVLTVFLKALEKPEMLPVLIDDPFGARGVNTVARDMSIRCSVESVQMELNSRLLYEESDGFCFDTIVESLAEICDDLNAMFSASSS